jgi:hypothetical protein
MTRDEFVAVMLISSGFALGVAALRLWFQY